MYVVSVTSDVHFRLRFAANRSFLSQDNSACSVVLTTLKTNSVYYVASYRLLNIECFEIINPRHACAARVTVVAVSVRLCVCVCVCVCVR